MDRNEGLIHKTNKSYQDNLRLQFSILTLVRASTKDYGNFGGEFLDDGVRMVEQPLGASAAKTGAQAEYTYTKTAAKHLTSLGVANMQASLQDLI